MPNYLRSSIALLWSFPLDFCCSNVPQVASHTFFLTCMLSIEWRTSNIGQYSSSHRIDFFFHIPSSSSPSRFFLLPRVFFSQFG
jgi:hypothetical protein